MTLYASMLTEEMQDMDSSSSSSEESSSGSSDSGTSSSSSSAGEALQEEFEMVLEAVAEVYNDLEGGMEDATIEWQGKRVIVVDVSEDDAVFHFRFRKKHLQEMADKLWQRLHEYFDVGSKKAGIIFDDGRYSCPYETLFLMVLFRFARPRRIRKEMEGYFGIRRSKISAGIFAMTNALHSLAVRYLDNPSIFHGRMAYYAERIYNKCGLAETTWGFIDGTLRKTCRPSYFQKLLYSGHKRCHGIKFQSVFTPDGLFACMYGPITGNRHDSFMMSRSQLLQKLRAFMPQDGLIVYSLYGDPAYPQSAYVYGGYRNPPAGSLQAAWNTQMSKVREVVEWGFANIVSNWSFLDFRAAMMVFKSPIAKYFIIAAFLVNLRTCFYGNQTMEYFECTTLTIDQYLSLID
jgi:quinol monooxygenase YgiN